MQKNWCEKNEWMKAEGEIFLSCWFSDTAIPLEVHVCAWLILRTDMPFDEGGGIGFKRSGGLQGGFKEVSRWLQGGFKVKGA